MVALSRSIVALAATCAVDDTASSLPLRRAMVGAGRRSSSSARADSAFGAVDFGLSGRSTCGRLGASASRRLMMLEFTYDERPMLAPPRWRLCRSSRLAGVDQFARARPAPPLADVARRARPCPRCSTWASAGSTGLAAARGPSVGSAPWRWAMTEPQRRRSRARARRRSSSSSAAAAFRKVSSNEDLKTCISLADAKATEVKFSENAVIRKEKREVRKEKLKKVGRSLKSLPY